MINEIKVNTTRLGNDAEKVKEYIDNIEKARKQIQTRASNINSMWDGQASEAFQKAIKSDLKELKEIIKNLKQVYDYETNLCQYK